MKKVLGAALAAALVGSTVASAMDYRIGFQAKTDGGWSPLQYRYSDYSYDKAVNAHVRESNGQAVGWSDSIGVGDQQILDSNGYGYSGAYEKGLAFWAGGKKGYRFQPSFGARSNSGAFTFGSTFMIKCKESDKFEGNGWNAYVGWKGFELKAATTGSLGYGAYVGTAGSFVGSTSALFLWEVCDNSIYRSFSKASGSSLTDYTGVKGDESNWNYFGYQISNAGYGVENISDKSSGFGLQYTQKLRDSKDTLNLRLVSMHSFSQDSNGYYSGSEYNAKYPIGWNVQANYRMPLWTFSATYKIKNAKNNKTGKYEKPEDFSMAGHFGVATSIIPGVSLSAGYAFIGEEVGKSYESAVNGTNYSHEFWGHNVGVAAGWKIGEWSFNAGNTTSLFLLSDYMKAKSSANKYAWRPYVGTTAYINATKRINGLMTGHLNFSFTDANLNSYTDGKAEASFSFVPSIDLAPSRGVNLNIALAMSLQNLSDQARGWWSDYGSESDFGSNAGEIYYTYPRTFTVSIPISLSFFI